MRVLVTGGAGYIGSHTVKALLARGHEPVVLDDLSTGHRDAVPAGLPFVEADLLDGTAVFDAMRRHEIGGVLHFAARSRIGEDAREPELYRRVNVDGTRSLLAAAARAGVKRIVVSSTAAVYGASKAACLTEDDPVRPLSVYGETKVEMERATRASCEERGAGWMALRYFNAAGASEDGTLGERHHPETHLVPLAVRAALGSGAPLVLFGDDYPTPDGTPIRDYVHVEDLAEAHVAALVSDASGALNLGTGEGTSVKRLIEAVEKETGRPVLRTVGPRRPGDSPRLVASFRKAGAILGWIPKRGLDRIVASVVRWERSRLS